MTPAERKKMIEENLGLVVFIAKSYRYSSMPMEDIIQEGNIGLIRAVDKFDPNRGEKFCTYASVSIRRRIKRAVNKNKTILFPEYAAIEWNSIRREISRNNILGNEIQIDEVVKESKHPCVMRWIAQNSCTTYSMDSPRYEEGDCTLHDLIEDDTSCSPEVMVEDKINLTRVLEAAKLLPHRQKQIIIERCTGDTKTLKDIGDRLGMSRERIRQIQNAAVINLKNILNGKPIIPERENRKAS